MNLILQNCYLNVRNTNKAISVISNAKYNEHILPLLKEPNLLCLRSALKIEINNIMTKYNLLKRAYKM